ncbi:hypothetical protein BGC07_19025 [Piscirickettsia litoralis]|uniref:Uncharacterized protein n=1 Tax=Piscirickettsia litoralis TaxID=1891921 RepID=A0ABX3A0H7_9GAMM|nr:hypothetical protein BGC07_19025 [Piscirickettsia litoralis]
MMFAFLSSENKLFKILRKNSSNNQLGSGLCFRVGVKNERPQKFEPQYKNAVTAKDSNGLRIHKTANNNHSRNKVFCEKKRVLVEAHSLKNIGSC